MRLPKALAVAEISFVRDLAWLVGLGDGLWMGSIMGLVELGHVYLLWAASYPRVCFFFSVAAVAMRCCRSRHCPNSSEDLEFLETWRVAWCAKQSLVFLRGKHFVFLGLL